MSNEEKHPTWQGLMNQAFEQWQVHEDWTFEAFVDHLDYLERCAVLLGTMNYQVQNGGWTQWHDNGYSKTWQSLRRLLQELSGGCEVSQKVLDIATKAAKAAFRYDGDCERTAGRNARSWDNYDDGEADWELFYAATDGLDTEYYAINDAFMDRCEEWLKARLAETTNRGGQ